MREIYDPSVGLRLCCIFGLLEAKELGGIKIADGLFQFVCYRYLFKMAF